MGYRSSMPIIELKLTGPATQKAAMLALWPEVQRVAGESLIFEGTEGLPAQIAKHLQDRQLSVTLSEQFTGGLLALQLSRASAPLLASEVVPAQEETLAPAGLPREGLNILPVWRCSWVGWMRNTLTSRWRRRRGPGL